MLRFKLLLCYGIFLMLCLAAAQDYGSPTPAPTPCSGGSDGNGDSSVVASGASSSEETDDSAIVVSETVPEDTDIAGVVTEGSETADGAEAATEGDENNGSSGSAIDGGLDETDSEVLDTTGSENAVDLDGDEDIETTENVAEDSETNWTQIGMIAGAGIAGLVLLALIVVLFRRRNDDGDAYAPQENATDNRWASEAYSSSSGQSGESHSVVSSVNSSMYSDDSDQISIYSYNSQTEFNASDASTHVDIQV